MEIDGAGTTDSGVGTMTEGHAYGKDYEVRVRIKNGPLMRMMRSGGFSSMAALARASGVSYGTICNYAALASAPMKHGKWQDAAVRISEVLKCLPEDLFPVQHFETALSRNTGTFEADLEDVSSFIGGPSDPFALVDARETAAALNRGLDLLTPRERQVLEMRFGLDDGRPKTLGEIGEYFNRSGARIRQVEMRALRKLKNPNNPVATIGRESLESIVGLAR